MSDFRFIAPCAPVLRNVPPIGAGWIHEPKLDGWRVQILKRGRDLRILTRRGNDITRPLPNLASAMMDLPTCIIDGELVSSTARSPCDFHVLSTVMRSKKGGDLSIWAFDLLRIDGRDIRYWPLHRRKTRTAAPGAIREQRRAAGGCGTARARRSRVEAAGFELSIGIVAGLGQIQDLELACRQWRALEAVCAALIGGGPIRPTGSHLRTDRRTA
jgi:hypothetical protein